MIMKNELVTYVIWNTKCDACCNLKIAILVNTCLNFNCQRICQRYCHMKTTYRVHLLLVNLGDCRPVSKMCGLYMIFNSYPMFAVAFSRYWEYQSSSSMASDLSNDAVNREELVGSPSLKSILVKSSMDSTSIDPNELYKAVDMLVKGILHNSKGNHTKQFIELVT